jgi:hypothetical protein
MVRIGEKGLSPGQRGALQRFSGNVMPSCALGRDQRTRRAIAENLLVSPARAQWSGLRTFREFCRNNTFLALLNDAGLRLYAIGLEETPLLLSLDAELPLGQSLPVMRDQAIIILHLSSAQYYDLARQKIVALTPVAAAPVPPPEPPAVPSPAISVAVLPPKPVVDHELDFCGLVPGESPKMSQALAKARRFSPLEFPVVITGATGTGKELFASIIHMNGPRKDSPFKPINCSAIPEALLEAELFGHEKGAFTGAVTRHIGIFEAASNGTVFLDEVGDMPLSMQTKLLRVIQEKEFSRVGSNTMIKTGARIISATNKDLTEETRAKRFREDLYYRLNVLEIKLPSLAERKEDIPLLARYFLAQFAREQGRAVPILSPEVAAFLSDHSWPGNIRELQNLLLRALVLAEGEITVQSLRDLGFKSV